MGHACALDSPSAGVGMPLPCPAPARALARAAATALPRIAGLPRPEDRMAAADNSGAFGKAADVPDDAALLMRYAAGDAMAARWLAERHAGRLLAHAMRMLGGDRAEAEDVVQDTMLRLWRMAPDWQDGQAQLSTWLYRVATNLCIDRRRRRRPSEPLDAVPDPVAPEPAGPAALMQSQRAAALQAALDRLPDRQRQAVILRHLDGLSNPEIAAVMDIGIEAVESLVARGKRALTTALRGQRMQLGYSDD